MVGSSSADKESRSHPSSSPSSWWLLCCRNCISCSSSSEEADKEGGHQEEEEKHGGWRAMPFILGNETFERLAVFGLFANFVVYLTRELHVETVSASNIMNIWFGVTNFAPLLGAYISDAYVDRAMFNGPPYPHQMKWIRMTQDRSYLRIWYCHITRAERMFQNHLVWCLIAGLELACFAFFLAFYFSFLSYFDVLVRFTRIPPRNQKRLL